MIEKTEIHELFKVDCLNMDKITEVAKIKGLSMRERLEKVYEDIPMSPSEIDEMQILIFVIEAMILCPDMRDERLSNLDRYEVENLAFELYLKVEVIRSQLGGCGYGEMGEGASEMIKKHLSAKYSERLDD